MIFADKLIEQRKKNGWTQEELAQKLHISRQAVSKWESARSIPDIDRVIDMANVFGVSTDYLLKDEIEDDGTGIRLGGSNGTGMAATSTDSDHIPPLRRVTLEQATDYLDLAQSSSLKIALGVAMCILAPAFYVLIQGINEYVYSDAGSRFVNLIGIPIMLILVATAVGIFITVSYRNKEFEFLDKEPFETEYGVDSVVRERKKARGTTTVVSIVIAVVGFIISPIPIIVADTLASGKAGTPAYDGVRDLAISFFLTMIAIGVFLLIRADTMNDAHNKLLEEGEFTRMKKERRGLVGTIATIYWLSVLAIFLAWSFITNDWHRTWIIWPVAAVLFGAIIAGTNAVLSHRDARR